MTILFTIYWVIAAFGGVISLIVAIHNDDTLGEFKETFWMGLGYSVLWPVFALILLFKGIIDAFKNCLE